MSRSFLKKSRNLLSTGVSLLVLFALFAMSLGTARADEDIEYEPLPQQQRRIPHAPRMIKPAQPVRHATAFKQVPGTKLQIRAVQYDGSTNGVLTVQVKNTTTKPIAFSAGGLYFVPEGDPDSAPQRLGAVGPMTIASAKAGKEQTQMTIAAGATMELNLDVFCIDSHRSSPTPQNKFAVGATRMPKELTATIEKKASKAVDEARARGHAAPRPAAKGQIQSEVWQSRDAKWIELDGEGEQEASK